jgi:hypothetical protein
MFGREDIEDVKIGRLPVALPAGVEVKVSDKHVVTFL